MGILNTRTSFHIETLGYKLIFLLSQAEVPILFSSSFTASKTLVTTTSKTHATTTSKTHVGTVVGVVVAIVVALVIIMAVIVLVKKKNRRVTSHSDPTTSAPCTVAMNQGAPNDNVEPMPQQFPPPGMQNSPPPSFSTSPPGSILLMNVEYSAYLSPHRGMTVVEAPPPYSSL